MQLVEQDESRRHLPLQQGPPSQSTGECSEEVKGEAGKSWSAETTGEVVPCWPGARRDLVSWAQGVLLVTHKRITVILLTLTLELLLKDGN